jgi:hypothetical protein
MKILRKNIKLLKLVILMFLMGTKKIIIIVIFVYI